MPYLINVLVIDFDPVLFPHQSRLVKPPNAGVLSYQIYWYSGCTPCLRCPAIHSFLIELYFAFLSHHSNLVRNCCMTAYRQLHVIKLIYPADMAT